MSSQRDLAHLHSALCDGPLDGAIADLEFDVLPLEARNDANRSHVPLVMLLVMQGEPICVPNLLTLAFLQKPFDVRVLFQALRLPRSRAATSCGFATRMSASNASDS